MIYLILLISCSKLNFKSKTNEIYNKMNLNILARAIKENKLKLINETLEKMNINSKDDLYRTPLFFAIKFKNEKLASLLIDKKANTDIADIKGRTPFLYSCKKNLTNITLKLLPDVNINYKDKKYFTALMYAVLQENIDLVTLLINKGARLDIKNIFGEGAIHLAVKKGNKEIIKLLKKEINSKIRHLKTPLMLACENKDIDTVEFLIANESNINSKNKKQETALHIASKVGDVEIVKLLLREDAEINEKNIKMETPLMIASKRGNKDLVSYLISSKAKISCKNKKYKTALHLAFEKGNIEVVENLYNIFNLNLNESSKMFKISLKKGYIDLVKFMLTKGFKANSPFRVFKVIEKEKELLPIIIAVENNHMELVKLLVKEGADVNSSSNNQSVLLKALINDSALNKFLKDNGIDPFYNNKKAKIKQAMTILNSKTEFSNKTYSDLLNIFNANNELIKFLIEQGANIKSREFS